MSSSTSARSVVLLLALLATALFVSLPSTSAQSPAVGCYECVVGSCASYFSGVSPILSIGSTTSLGAAAECSTLNQDIGGFIATAQNATCAANVAQLACEIIATVNATETACNTSSIGVGTPFGNQSYFEQRCASAVGCLGYFYQDEVVAAQACNSFEAFLGAVVAQPEPSTIACAPCNITACYGLSTVATDVTFWAGSLPGLNGSSCAAQQATAATFLANGAAGVPVTVVQQAVCDPLAALTLADSQAACNGGAVDGVYNAVVFSAAATANQTWESYCQPSLDAVFNNAFVSQLVAAGYCINPAAGLTNYALQYLVSPPANSTTPSNGGCYECVVGSCASYFSGVSPILSIGSTTSLGAAAECSTLNQDIGGFIATAQNATCAANVAQLACEIIATVNATETACNTSSIGVGTPFGNQSYFEQRCASAVGCLGYFYQDEVVAAQACNSFEAFLGAVVAQPEPSTIACAPCNITACYGLSTVATDVTFWAGSLPGLNGSSCAAQQATAATFLANGAAGVPVTVVQQAVCDPLAALTLADSQAACNGGAVDGVYNAVVFSAAATANQTWESYCQPSLDAVFNNAFVSQLVAAGYCINPAAGLTNYALQYLVSPPANATSSSSSSTSTPAVSSTSSSTATSTTSTPVVFVTSVTSPSTVTASSSSSVVAPTASSSSSAVISGSSSGTQITHINGASRVSGAVLVAASAIAAAALLL